MKLITRSKIKKLGFVIITTFTTILLYSCNAVSTCNITDDQVIRYVIDDLSLVRFKPLRFKPLQDVINLCNNYKANLIGCTTNDKTYVFEELYGFTRVEIIAHELQHQKAIEISLLKLGTVNHPLPENEAIAYGKKIAVELCS